LVTGCGAPGSGTPAPDNPDVRFNLCTSDNGGPISSGHADRYPESMAFDTLTNVAGNAWCSSTTTISGNAWLGYKFTTNPLPTIRKIKIYTGGFGGAISSVIVRSSADGIIFQQLIGLGKS
jgi:hypothetical protein